LHCKEEKGSIPAAPPSIQIWRGEKGIDLSARQELNGLTIPAFARHCQYSLSECTVGWFLDRNVPEKGVNRRESDIPAARTNTPVFFEVIEESTDKCCVQIRDRHCRGFLLEAVLSKFQQQAEGVTIACNGV
jgi:hypothetical protein